MSAHETHARNQRVGRGSRALGLRSAAAVWALLVLAALALASAAAADRWWPRQWERPREHRACSASALSSLTACRFDIKDDYYEALARCANVPGRSERRECTEEAADERKEAREECGDVFEARVDLCERLGEDPYDPDFAPENFESDPGNVDAGDLNPYLPVAVGNQWILEGGDEVITINVLPKTKLIEGVRCLVVNDLVTEDGVPIEDTNDWFALGKDSSVHYCGEEVQDFETFEGDDPVEPELVSIEGAFKVGRESAQPGILMPATLTVGDVYRQEYAIGEAEDAAEILSTDYTHGEDPELDELVPQALAELLCDDADCLVAREFSPLEPEVFERKYFAPGIGIFLEVDPEEGEVVQLVDCNMNPKCDDLPEP